MGILPTEMRPSLNDIAQRLEAAFRADRTVTLKPETALVVAVAVRAFTTQPTRDDVVKLVCDRQEQCEGFCYPCIALANKISQLYGGERS